MASVETLNVQVYGVDEMAPAAEPASRAGVTRPTSATSAASELSAPSLVTVRRACVPAAPRLLSPMRSRYERSFGSTEIYLGGALETCQSAGGGMMHGMNRTSGTFLDGGP